MEREREGEDDGARGMERVRKRRGRWREKEELKGEEDEGWERGKRDMKR